MTVLLFIFLYLAIAVGVGSLWSSALDRSAAIRNDKVDPGDRVMSCLAPMLWPFTGAPALVYVINVHMRARAADSDIRQRAIQGYKDSMDSKAKHLEKEIFGEPEPEQPRVDNARITDYTRWDQPKLKPRYKTAYEEEARKIMERKRGW